MDANTTTFSSFATAFHCTLYDAFHPREPETENQESKKMGTNYDPVYVPHMNTDTEALKMLNISMIRSPLQGIKI